MSNVIPIRECSGCKRRLLDVVDRGMKLWLCGDCNTEAEAEADYTEALFDANYTEDPDDT